MAPPSARLAAAAVALLALAAAAHPAQASRPLTEESSSAAARLSTAAAAAAAADETQPQQQQQPADAAAAADPAAGIPHTHPVYVEYKVAHSASYMSADNRSEKLLRLVREAARVSPGLRVSAAAVDATGRLRVSAAAAVDATGPAPGAATAAAAAAAPATLTYGAVVFNEEDGAAERELAALADEGALERLAAAAKGFGVVVSALEGRPMGRRRRRRRALLSALPPPLPLPRR